LDKIIEKVAKFKRDINRQEPGYLNTTLHVAVSCGHKNVVDWLIEQKANLNTQEVHGWTALHFCAIKGHSEIAKALVAAGANQGIKDLEGLTAKQLALTPPEWAPIEKEAVEERAKVAALLK
jgi:ankyrin repeat protein